MTTIPNRSTFESACAGQAPWDIGKPQKPFIDIADRITGSVEDRRRYVEGLARVLKPGGRLFLLCFSDEEPGTQGPRRVSKTELRDAFAEGWSIESIEPSRFEVRPDLKDLAFSEGGPKAWFVVVQRAG